MLIESIREYARHGEGTSHRRPGYCGSNRGERSLKVAGVVLAALWKRPRPGTLPGKRRVQGRWCLGANIEGQGSSLELESSVGSPRLISRTRTTTRGQY